MKGSFGSFRVNFSKVKDRPVSEIFGTADLKPSEMTRKLWDFIKSNGLTKG